MLKKIRDNGVIMGFWPKATSLTNRQIRYNPPAIYLCLGVRLNEEKWRN